MKNDKNDMNTSGIRSDRLMTPLEVQRAAMNYRAVKRAAESDAPVGIIDWIFVGAGVLIILYGVVCALFG